MSLRVSVIVPTYRDWPRLALCLEGLSRQTLPAEQFEIIVADNDATSNPPRLPEGVRYVHAPAGYSYAARNAGAGLARGAVLAFTDADCQPAPQWLQAGLAALDAHPEWDLVGGRIDIVAGQQNTAVRYESLFEFQQRQLVELGGYSVTANLFVRHEAYKARGGFDGTLKSCGDSEFCTRLGQLGHRIGYADAALVRHPARETLPEILDKNRRIASGQYDRLLRESAGSRRRFYSLLLHAFRPRPREWYYILAGGRGSEVYTPAQRLPVMLLRLFLHYQIAWRMLHGRLSDRRVEHHIR